MARLSRDALKLLAHMNNEDTYLIVKLAEDVFDGKKPSDDPAKTMAVALNRAKRAASTLVSRKHAKPDIAGSTMTAIKSRDTTANGVQAQSLMNFMVRGGVERRSAEQEAAPPPEVPERRQSRERRMIRPATGPPTAPAGTPKKLSIVDNTKVANDASIASPFTAKHAFKRKGTP